MAVFVSDNLFSPALLRSAVASWPDEKWPHWHRYNNGVANKFGSVDRLRIPTACQVLLDQMAVLVGGGVLRNTNSFVDYELHAAGMHMIPPGGFLGRHLDAEVHPIRSWGRTHSIVLSLNENWRPEWGGELRLEGSEDIPLEFGRMVIFETAGQWHEVLRTAATADNRMTLALFAWEYRDSNSGRSSAFFSE